jgi:cytochrome c biogenesis protein CcmG/thiol:disulfide interchange protein DsbE
MSRPVLWLPLIVALLGLGGIALYLWSASRSDPSSRNMIRSQMIGKPMPEFALQPSVPGHAGLSSADLRSGRPHLVNVFASWCIPCRAEAPQLLALKMRGVPIEGVAIRDRSEDVAGFLAQWGDPFDRIGADPESRVQFALGSSGVPETFVVDGKGIIRHQHIGDIRPEDMATIVAAYESAR